MIKKVRNRRDREVPPKDYNNNNNNIYMPISPEISVYMASLARKSHKTIQKKYGKQYYSLIRKKGKVENWAVDNSKNQEKACK